MVDELHSRTLVLREALAIAAKDPAAAIGMLTAALALGDDSTAAEKATIAKHAGALCQGIGELERAAAFYRRAAATDQSDGYVHLALGRVYRELGRIEDARATLDLCLAAAETGGDEDLLDAATRRYSRARLTKCCA